MVSRALPAGLLAVCAQRRRISGPHQYLHRWASDQPGIWPREPEAWRRLQRISPRLRHLPGTRRMAGDALGPAASIDPGSDLVGRDDGMHRCPALHDCLCDELAHQHPLSARRGRGDRVSGSQSVRRAVGSVSRARLHQRLDLCRCRSGQRTDTAAAQLADHALRLEGGLLVQRGAGHCGRHRLVVHGTRPAGRAFIGFR